jgi:hypothetical protein
VRSSAVRLRAVRERSVADERDGERRSSRVVSERSQRLRDSATQRLSSTTLKLEQRW